MATAAKAWADYAKDQEYLAFVYANGLVQELTPPYETAIANQPSLEASFKDFTVLALGRSATAKRALANSKARKTAVVTKQKKAAAKSPAPSPIATPPSPQPSAPVQTTAPAAAAPTPAKEVNATA